MSSSSLTSLSSATTSTNAGTWVTLKAACLAIEATLPAIVVAYARNEVALALFEGEVSSLNTSLQLRGYLAELKIAKMGAWDYATMPSLVSA